MSRLPANITVSYGRLPGYPQERLSSQVIEAVDKLQCAWDDRVTLAKQLLGFTRGSVLYFPHKYDFGDDPISYIYCKSVSIDPLEDGYENGTYIKALLTVTYANLEYSIPDAGLITYVTESLEPASEFLTLNPTKLYWADGTLMSDGEAPTKIIRMIDWVYTIHFLYFIPAWVWTHPGTVNNANVYSRELNKLFTTGQLLCGNPSLSREITSEGTTAWTITVRLTFRETGWNLFPRPDKTTNNEMNFEPIYSDDGGANVVYPYGYSNFGNIIL